jgi:hypothetical protein
VLITGDARHFRENYEIDGVPWCDFDREPHRRQPPVVGNVSLKVRILV